MKGPAAPTLAGPSLVLAQGTLGAYHARCADRGPILLAPSDIPAYPHATAERLNVREPSRAPTETGSRGEYDTAEKRNGDPRRAVT